MKIPVNTSAVGDVASSLMNTAKNHSVTSLYNVMFKNTSRISPVDRCSTDMPSLEGAAGLDFSNTATTTAPTSLKEDELNGEKKNSLGLLDFEYFIEHQDAYQQYMANGTNSSINSTSDEELQEMAYTVRRLAIPLAVAFFTFLIIFGIFFYRAGVRRRDERERQQSMLRACRMRPTRTINLVGREPQEEMPPDYSPELPIYPAAPPLQMHQIKKLSTQRPLLPCQPSTSKMAVSVAEQDAAERVKVVLKPMEQAAEYVVQQQPSTINPERQFHARHVAEGRVEPLCGLCNERLHTMHVAEARVEPVCAMCNERLPTERYVYGRMTI